MWCSKCLLAKNLQKHAFFQPEKPKIKVHYVTGDTKMHKLVLIILHCLRIQIFTLIISIDHKINQIPTKSPNWLEYSHFIGVCLKCKFHYVTGTPSMFCLIFSKYWNKVARFYLKLNYNHKNENNYVELHDNFLRQHGKKWISIFDDMEFWGTPNRKWNSYRPNISSLS